jgi:N-sulfoglucosamine sulfohydrolase
MTRFYLLPIVILLSVSLSTLSAAERPNVLLITVDDMNCDSVGAFGCQVPGITPNIDRLASEGMWFEHAHVTIAICMPTRAVWMTGRYPHRSGALGFDRINRGVPTLLETLKKAGYFTGIMAKVPHVVPSRGKAWDVVVKAGELNAGRDPKLYYEKGKEFFRKAKSSGGPFFLMANAQDPHRPFAQSPRETSRRNAKKRRKGGFPGVSRTYKPSEITLPGFLPDLPKIRTELAQYFTSVHRADEVVGSVLRALDEAGHADDTIVMFMSDHGMPLPFAKTNCWYHSTRTPWIVRWPGNVKAGLHDEKHFISGIDLAPTILNAVGLPALDGVDGRSFLPVLRGESQAGRTHVFTHINRTAGRKEYPMRAVQDKQFGYIYNGWSDGKTVFRNESQSGLTMNAMRAAAASDEKIAARVKHFLYRTPEELYDYSADPDARHNLAGDPKYAGQLAKYRKMMAAHMESTGDPNAAAFAKVAGK